jgi:UDP-N-acetyl-2-amino-2-deoxyglucuronate dehydrogenase
MSNTKLLQVGLIGAGNSAHNIAKTLSTIPDVKLAAIADLKLDAAKDIIEQYQIPQNRVFTDYKEMIKLPELSVIIISLPHNLHKPVALDVFAAKKHVLCEKPLAMEMKDGQEMIEAGKKAKLILGTFFQNRFYDASQKAKQLIESGQLGKILHGQVNVLWSRDQDYYDKSPWRGKWATEGGGSLINQASHSIDLMIWLMGKPKTVYGVFGAITHKIEVDDNAAALVTFENGAYATIQTSTSVSPGYPAKVNVFGTDGMVSVDGNKLKVVTKDGKETEQDFEKDIGTATANDPKKFSLQAQQRLMTNYFDAVRSKKQPLVDGAEGLRAIQVIKAIYASNGQKVINL